MYLRLKQRRCRKFMTVLNSGVEELYMVRQYKLASVELLNLKT